MNSIIVFVDKFQCTRLELVSAVARLGLRSEHLSLAEFLEKGNAILPSQTHAAVLSTYLSGLDDIFSAAHKLKNANVSRILIHPLTALYGSIVLDFEDLGAIVLPPVPTMEQFLQSLAVADAAETRAMQRGVMIRLSGSTDPWINGAHGGAQQYELGNGRQRSIFFRLIASVAEAVPTEDLAAAADCSYEAVKIYVQRLRNRYEAIRKKLGLKISAFAFIEEVHGGYRLNVRIKRPI